MWDTFRRTLGVSIQPAIRRSLEEKYDRSLLELVAAEMPEYLAGFKDSTGTASCIYTLADMIQRGEWKRKPEPLPVTEPPEYFTPVTLHAQPWVDDELVRSMPTLVQALVAARLQGTGICTDYGIAGALAVLAGICGNRLRFTSWGDTYHYPNVYLVLVGETKRSYKSSVGKWVKQLLSEVDPAILAADESSVEAMIRDLAERPSRLWIQDEFAGLIASMKTRDYMRPVREMLLSLFDHGGVYRRRLMRAEFSATNPALSLLTTIQPAVMGEELFSGRNVDSGFINRLLLVYGEAQEAWPRIEDYGVYRHQIIDRLRELSRQPLVTAMADHLTEIAEMWDGREEEEFGEYGKWVATRANIHALKIAALLEAADGWPGGKRISADWMQVAMALLDRWFRRTCAVIKEHHLKQPGERERREFFALACHATHNKRGPQLLGVLQAEMQCSKRQAQGWLEDLEDRGWVRTDDLQNVVCVKSAPVCGAKS